MQGTQPCPSSRSAEPLLAHTLEGPSHLREGATGRGKMSPSDQILPSEGFHPRGPQTSPQYWLRSMEWYWSVSSVPNSCPCHPLLPADHGIHDVLSMSPAHVSPEKP